MAAEETVEAFVEIPKGSRNKYEYTEVLGPVRPAMTLVGVAALVHPDLLVEVEAEAEVEG